MLLKISLLRLGCSQSSVSETISKWYELGTIKRLPGGGRKKTSAIADQRMKLTVMRDK